MNIIFLFPHRPGAGIGSREISGFEVRSARLISRRSQEPPSDRIGSDRLGPVRSDQQKQSNQNPPRRKWAPASYIIIGALRRWQIGEWSALSRRVCVCARPRACVCACVCFGVEEFEVVPSTLSAGWLQAPPRRMLGAELPDRPTEAFSWRTFRSWGSTMALCVSEPTRLPLHISRGMGGGLGGVDGARRSVQYQRGVRSGSSTANSFPVCSHYMELFLDRAGVCYLMRPCKPRGGGGVNPPNLDRSRNRVGREKLIYVVGNTFITFV